jgi:hypothetical protein
MRSTLVVAGALVCALASRASAQGFVAPSQYQSSHSLIKRGWATKGHGPIDLAQAKPYGQPDGIERMAPEPPRPAPPQAPVQLQQPAKSRPEVNPALVTRANYEKLKLGMDLDEVERILGQGKEQADSGRTIRMIWRGQGQVTITVEFTRASIPQPRISGLPALAKGNIPPALLSPPVEISPRLSAKNIIE